MRMRKGDTSWGYITQYSMLDKLTLPPEATYWNTETYINHLMEESPGSKLKDYDFDREWRKKAS